MPLVLTKNVLPGCHARVVEPKTCLFCGKALTPTGKRGRPSNWCSPECRSRTGYLRRKARGRGFDPCTLCGKLMQPTPTAAAVRVCLACRQRRGVERRAERAARVLAAQGPWIKECSNTDCRKSYLAEKMSRRFCSTDCFLAHSRAQERIRDAERRRRRREEEPAEALLWRGDIDAGYLIAGPPAAITSLTLRTDPANPFRPTGTYIPRCPNCKWLTECLDPDEHIWGCHHCYTKIALVTAPTQEPDPSRVSPNGSE